MKALNGHDGPQWMLVKALNGHEGPQRLNGPLRRGRGRVSIEVGGADASQASEGTGSEYDF